MKEEIWKVVEEAAGLYEVSNFGRVLSRHKNKIRILRQNILRDGYHQVALYFERYPHDRKVHRLVAQAFLEPIGGKPYVNHKDGNKSNNSLENLEYCTMAENNAHAGFMNLKPIGSNHTNSKLTHEQLKEVRAMLAKGDMTHKAISKIYGVHRATISGIFQNKSYKKEIT